MIFVLLIYRQEGVRFIRNTTCDLTADQLSWIALDYSGVPNKSEVQLLKNFHFMLLRLHLKEILCLFFYFA